MKKQVFCQFEKQTPKALQYQQVDESGHRIKKDQDGLVVGNVYLRKAAIKGPIPKQIVVTIEY